MNISIICVNVAYLINDFNIIKEKFTKLEKNIQHCLLLIECLVWNQLKVNKTFQIEKIYWIDLNIAKKCLLKWFIMLIKVIRKYVEYLVWWIFCLEIN